MIDRTKLLTDLQALLRKLEADLLERSDSSDVPEVGETLRSEYQRAKQAERTAQSYEEWRSDSITQMASAWVLSGVFVRFLEDNKLVDPPIVSGTTLTPSPSSQREGKQTELDYLLPGEKGAGGMRAENRLQRARDEHELYFRDHPKETDREYWLHGFDRIAQLPGTREIFGANNRIRDLPNWLSGDAAGELLRFFQRVEPETGRLVHDFTDEQWDTRFLGDLYQDVSEAARKKYALLQTPEFVESFILDRTLDPAIAEFGLAEFRMIDPACGSGHFLLGSFRRLLDRWLRKEPGTNVRELVQRSLNSIHGVDVNPYAVAIARFRLLLAAMRASGIERLRDAPAFRIQVACGDSLLHGEGNQLLLGDWAPMAHYFRSEDAAELNRMLVLGHYHAVVANPPYITPKDAALNAAYRKRYRSCHRQYSLAVPFMERIFQLAVERGFTGQITANSFMKREFGKKLIEEFIPRVDLTHVIDTSGAYIPGHGTPTVILFGRNRGPIASTIRTVMGIRSEPSTPDVPAKGLVWSAILEQVDRSGSQSEFVSVAEALRTNFCKHPWSIGGGGASDLKQYLDDTATSKLSGLVTEIGFMCITKADEVFSQPLNVFCRARAERNYLRSFGVGEEVRDWSISSGDWVVFPYDESIATVHIENIKQIEQFMWQYKTDLYDRKLFGGKTYREAGKPWYEYGQIPVERMKIQTSITFAFVATHNHFVLDRGGKVFKQTAPVIKLPANAIEDDYLALLSLLNSSTACFWGRQTFFPRGGFAAGKWEERLEWDATKLLQFPIPQKQLTELARKLEHLATELQNQLPARNLSSNHDDWLHTLQQMIAFQEELDWQCYQLYGLLTEDLTHHSPPPLTLGQRAFELVMARKMAAGELETTWFERHNSTPITELPSEWSDDYKQIVQRRIEVIECDHNIALIEQPEYKRRWNTEPWDSQLERALRNWLCDRLERYFDFDGRMCPHPPTPSPQGEGELDNQSPSFPQREGSREGEVWNPDISKLDGQLRQIPEALLQRARELRQNQTPVEEVMWECLRDRRLLDAKFRRQHNLGQYIADFYCNAARLVVELDGDIHQTQQIRDADRDEWMQAHGFIVLRFHNSDVLAKIDQVLATIAQYIDSPLSLGRGGRGVRANPQTKSTSP